jgi:hypothetical protein
VPQPQPVPPQEQAFAFYAPDKARIEVHGKDLTVVLNGEVIAAPNDTT